MEEDKLNVYQQRYQVIPLTIPSATAAGVFVQASVKLDQGCKFITGIGVVVVDDGGTTPENFLIGAKSQRQDWVDPIPAQMWDPDGAPLDLKYLTQNIMYGMGDTFFIQAAPIAALVSNAVIYMTLRLEASFTQLPRKS